jgi:hypothetical protein
LGGCGALPTKQRTFVDRRRTLAALSAKIALVGLLTSELHFASLLAEWFGKIQTKQQWQSDGQSA